MALLSQYVPKVIDGQAVNVIQFPDIYKHADTDISEFRIEGGFSGDRATDKQMALDFLRSKNYDAIPSGYILHHDVENGVFQLIQENVHNDFSHY